MSFCTNVEVQWHDRKRYYGLPLSFEIYEVSEDRLFLTCGFLRQDHRQIQLYRVRDISLTRSLPQRMFGVGTVTVTTSDKKVIVLENIRNPVEVKELLYHNMEQQKRYRRFHRGGFHFYDDDDFCLYAS